MKLPTIVFLVWLLVALICIPPTSSKGGRGGGGGRSSSSRGSSSRGSSSGSSSSGSSRNSNSGSSSGSNNDWGRRSSSSSDRKTPDTRPSAPKLPDIKPPAPKFPDTRPSAPKLPDTRPSAPKFPDTRPSAPELPDIKPSAPKSSFNQKDPHSNSNPFPHNPHFQESSAGNVGNLPPYRAGTGNLGNPPPYAGGTGNLGQPPLHSAGTGNLGNPPPYSGGTGNLGHPPPYSAGTGNLGNSPPYSGGTSNLGQPPPYSAGTGSLGKPPPYSGSTGLGQPPPYSAGTSNLGYPSYSAGTGNLGNPPYSAGTGNLGYPPYSAGTGNLGNPPYSAGTGNLGNPPYSAGSGNLGYPSYGTGTGNQGYPPPYGAGIGNQGYPPPFGAATVHQGNRNPSAPNQPGYASSYGQPYAGGNPHGPSRNTGGVSSAVLGAAAIHSLSHPSYGRSSGKLPDHLKFHKKKGFLESFLSMGKGSKDSKKPKMYKLAYPKDHYSRHEPRRYGLSPLHALLPMRMLLKPPKPYKPSNYVKHWFLPYAAYHGGWRRKSLFDLDYEDENNYVGRRCVTPFAPKHGKINCTRTHRGMLCDSECKPGFVFANDTARMTTECWHFSGYWNTTRYLPECKPFCEKKCENGGVCTDTGECRCSPEYRGPQCQYHFLECDIRKLANGNPISWTCSHSTQETTCIVECPPPKEFVLPPAEKYHCSPNGTWTPNRIPNCVGGLVMQED